MQHKVCQMLLSAVHKNKAEKEMGVWGNGDKGVEF